MRELIFRNFDSIFSAFVCLWALGVAYTVFRLIRKFYSRMTIESALSTLGNNLTNEGAEDFCRFVEGATIYNHPEIYHKLRAGWGMVRGSRNISRRVKDDVKNALLRRGVNING